MRFSKFSKSIAALAMVTGTCGASVMPVLADDSFTKAGKGVTVVSDNSGSWAVNSTGWWYRFKNGSYIRATAPEDYTLAKIDGTLYAFDTNGYMIAGWFQSGDDWMFANSNGAVLENGWLKWGDNWYYFANKKMVTSQFVDNGNYYVGKDGKMVTGWQKFDDDWYYFRASNGSMVKSCWLQHGNYWYYLGANGAMVTNTNVGGYWVNENGQWIGNADGWKHNSVGWWYSQDGSYLADEWLNSNGTWYFFDDAGYMVTGWRQIGTDGAWYFFNSDGAMQTGWVKVGGSWYHFNGDGAMDANTVVDGYMIGADGKLVR